MVAAQSLKPNWSFAPALLTGATMVLVATDSKVRALRASAVVRLLRTHLSMRLTRRCSGLPTAATELVRWTL